MFHKKHFSLQETRKILPEIKIKLKRITELKTVLDAKGYDIQTHQYFGGLSSNGTGKFPIELEELVRLVNEISITEILLKGIDNGLIDFPHIRSNGEEVYLCYLLGEDDIEFWHKIEDGFAGRRRIQDL